MQALHQRTARTLLHLHPRHLQQAQALHLGANGNTAQINRTSVNPGKKAVRAASAIVLVLQPLQEAVAKEVRRRKGAAQEVLLYPPLVHAVPLALQDLVENFTTHVGCGRHFIPAGSPQSAKTLNFVSAANESYPSTS